ncbi:hypothetical protein DHEL01_v208549 [Diaporthe helianthi]|uniref:CorA-like transporter domain-containing protein n=1 Tax=Diaporthe helianthi TaxID=158607 RepID=A0A2P5HS27_DIAHE|nr:hypothetical protein DHEL01_v208549 [Diaporthe helianthi]
MLLELLTWHQITPAYVDFMLVFGMQTHAKDLLFGGFRANLRIKPAHAISSIAALGRSGRQYELCYTLKSVSYSQQSDSYSIRQSAFYHRFDVMRGNTLWIVTKGGEDLHHRFKELTGKESARQMFTHRDDCFRSSLSAHLAFCYWSTEDWHGYIRHMETMVSQYTDMALLGHRGEGDSYEIYTGRNIQQLQIWHEKVCDVIAVLDSNVEVISSMAAFYRNLQAKNNFPLKDSSREDVDDFVEELYMIISSSKLQISRAKSLRQRTMERSELTFFSTDIIKYQGDNGSGSGTFSSTAMTRWLQVTIPLTVVTLLAAQVLKTRATVQAITKSKSPANNAEKGVRHEVNWRTRAWLRIRDLPLQSCFADSHAGRNHSSATQVV